MSDAFATVRQLVTQELIDAYAELSGDYNPLHVDPAFAADSAFGSTIAHGPIALQAFFSAATEWVGADALPPGASVQIVYRSPVRPGDEVCCEALDVTPDAHQTTVQAACSVGDTVAVAVTATFPQDGRIP
jgi:3-hydroxybutyryl-CoA dehydratase